MARPKLSTDNLLSEAVETALNKSDFLVFAANAERAGLTRSAYARQQIVGGKVIIKQSRQLDKSVYLQLVGVCRNLNQYTKLSHRDKKPHPSVLRVLKSLENWLGKYLDDYESA